MSKMVKVDVLHFGPLAASSECVGNPVRLPRDRRVSLLRPDVGLGGEVGVDGFGSPLDSLTMRLQDGRGRCIERDSSSTVSLGVLDLDTTAGIGYRATDGQCGIID